MNKFEINPFERSALTDSRQLAGRSNEFSRIRFLLRNAARQEHKIKSMMICGDRGVGKTSFLNLIELECPVNNIIPIRLNLTSSNSINSNEFFWYLFKNITDSLFAKELLGGVGGDLHIAIQEIVQSDEKLDSFKCVFKTPILRRNFYVRPNTIFEFDSLISDLRLIRSQICSLGTDSYNSKTKFLFLVDEAQNIYSNTGIIEQIRYIVQQHDLGYGFVFAGDMSFEKSEWDRVFGGTHREFEIFTLNYFEDVDCVKEYFRKSLETIGWSENDIVEKYFYRFNFACNHIYQLTSGKPAWINEIAEKMFQRCMTGESKELKFDKQAQSDVKVILKNGGKLDNTKIDYIDSLPPKYQKWLGKIFASEYYTLRSIYHYAKFTVAGENRITIGEFKEFCETLIRAGIIIINQRPTSRQFIGFNNREEEEEILDSEFNAFGEGSDSMKLWLQMHSEGAYGFRLASPDLTFVEYINSELSQERGNSFIVSMPNLDLAEDDKSGIPAMVEKIMEGTLEIEQLEYSMVRYLYRLVKRLNNSKKRHMLQICLIDHKTQRYQAWSIYKTNEHDRLVEYIFSSQIIQRLQSYVEYYNNQDVNLTLNIQVSNLPDPSLASFQACILKTGDAKKSSIVIDDKMKSLFTAYFKKDLDSAYENSNYIYSLFVDGHFLEISELNNIAYVFMNKKEFDKVEAVLNSAYLHVRKKSFNRDQISSATLVIYNLAILNIYNLNYENALSLFYQVIDFVKSQDVDDLNAGALLVLDEESDAIELKEFIGEDVHISTINIVEMTNLNIRILRSHLKYED